MRRLRARGGKQVVTPGARALTNHGYAESKAWAAKQRSRPPVRDRCPLRARRAPSGGATQPAIRSSAAFGVLDGVRWSESQWNIVYDPVHLRVSFRTRASPAIKTLELGKQLGKIDGSCARPALVLDIDTGRGRRRHRAPAPLRRGDEPLAHRTQRPAHSRASYRPARRHDGRLPIRPPCQRALIKRDDLGSHADDVALAAAHDGDQRLAAVARPPARERRAAGVGLAARDAQQISRAAPQLGQVARLHDQEALAALRQRLILRRADSSGYSRCSVSSFLIRSPAAATGTSTISVGRRGVWIRGANVRTASSSASSIAGAPRPLLAAAAGSRTR